MRLGSFFIEKPPDGRVEDTGELQIVVKLEFLQGSRGLGAEFVDLYGSFLVFGRRKEAVQYFYFTTAPAM